MKLILLKELIQEYDAKKQFKYRFYDPEPISILRAFIKLNGAQDQAELHPKTIFSLIAKLQLFELAANKDAFIHDLLEKLKLYMGEVVYAHCPKQGVITLEYLQEFNLLNEINFIALAVSLNVSSFHLGIIELYNAKILSQENFIALTLGESAFNIAGSLVFLNEVDLLTEENRQRLMENASDHYAIRTGLLNMRHLHLITQDNFEALFKLRSKRTIIDFIHLLYHLKQTNLITHENREILISRSCYLKNIIKYMPHYNLTQKHFDWIIKLDKKSLFSLKRLCLFAVHEYRINWKEASLPSELKEKLESTSYKFKF